MPPEEDLPAYGLYPGSGASAAAAVCTLERDRVAASAEFLAEFRSDIEAFQTRAPLKLHELGKQLG